MTENSCPPGRSLLVLLGASEFPKSGLGGAAAFSETRRRLLGYFGKQMHVANDVLDLFDTKKAWGDIDSELASWLTAQRATPGANLFVIYVGHGGFRDLAHEYYLAIRSTARDNAYYTSIPFEGLTIRLRSSAAQLRRFIILDSCFSAAAARQLQAPLPEAVGVRVDRALAGEVEESERGTLLLSSSSQFDLSLHGFDGLTMFGNGLLNVLEGGDRHLGRRLSMDDVHRLVRYDLTKRHGAAAVLPELHTGDQSNGLLSEMPLFPNPAFELTAKRRHDWLAERLADSARATALLEREAPPALVAAETSIRARWELWLMHLCETGDTPMLDRLTTTASDYDVQQGLREAARAIRNNEWPADAPAAVLSFRRVDREWHLTALIGDTGTQYSLVLGGDPLTLGPYARVESRDCGGRLAFRVSAPKDSWLLGKRGRILTGVLAISRWLLSSTMDQLGPGEHVTLLELELEPNGEIVGS